MGFESVRLSRSGTPVDTERVRAWLRDQPWAFEDPHGTPCFHLSSDRRAAAQARAARHADPSRFPLGVVVEVLESGVILEARADRATLDHARAFVEFLVRDGLWQMRRDWLAHDEPADLGILFGR